MSRGARNSNSVFMGRSGIYKTEGKLVARLKDARANSHVASNDVWHMGIQPKWQGTWNLHIPLEVPELNFFLLKSSLSGCYGSATESNYCAASQFLDAFAQWRKCHQWQSLWSHL
ncbi:unnamed protein product [Clonostachys chloroleuca]|uniref:Ketoreductase domain-containing protein n=1 Tax=Clonostachys chloroleuca TaxID=1926264 RepID=A0AA35PVX2_9HYPO|nr:unnamed protein product [Clonostachys chloroleuca]